MFSRNIHYPVDMRTAYRCRAYPDQAQQQVLVRTFGCARVVWNRTLAVRRARYAAERKSMSYAETDRALTMMKKDPDLAFLGKVSSVPLQQALRHQHMAFQAFFAGRAGHPRFRSRHGRQSAHYTRSAFTMRGASLRLAKTGGPLKFIWSWPEVDLATLDPIANPRHMERKARSLARYQRRLARCQKGSANRAKAKAKVARAHRKIRSARQDFLHRASTHLVRANDVIVIEGPRRQQHGP
jgi:putative transposase